MAALFPVPSAPRNCEPDNDADRAGRVAWAKYPRCCNGVAEDGKRCTTVMHTPRQTKTDVDTSHSFASGFAVLLAVLSAGRAEQMHEREALTLGNKVDNRNGAIDFASKKLSALTLAMATGFSCESILLERHAGKCQRSSDSK